MKKLLFCAAMAAAMATTANAKALKVLMIGNSFSQSVMQQTPQVAKDLGCELDLVNLNIGGCPLEKHWANVEKAAKEPDFAPYSVSISWTSSPEKDAPIHKAMKGRRANIPQMLAAEKWDIVTIQQASGKSAFADTYQPYADNLIAKIKELAPQAEIRIQETWSYSPYDGRLTTWKMTPDQMYEALHKAYGDLAAKYGFKIIPTGTTVQEFRARFPVKYAKVLTRKEREALVKPAVPDFYGDVCGKAHWGTGKRGADAKEIKLRIDAAHFNPDGQFLQACVWVQSLFGVDVTKGTYKPGRLSAERATLMRACAHDVAVRAAK